MAQTMLYLDGQTQSLWVEHLNASSIEHTNQLVEIAYRHSREKHFQRVYFREAKDLVESLAPWKPMDWHGDVKYLKTTKGR